MQKAQSLLGPQADQKELHGAPDGPEAKEA